MLMELEFNLWIILDFECSVMFRCGKKVRKYKKTRVLNFRVLIIGATIMGDAITWIV